MENLGNLRPFAVGFMKSLYLSMNDGILKKTKQVLSACEKGEKGISFSILDVIEKCSTLQAYGALTNISTLKRYQDLQ